MLSEVNMAAPKKKRGLEQQMETVKDADALEDSDFDDGDEEDMDDESDGSEVGNQQVQVDFEARTPEESDFHGMRKLIQQLFLKASVNLSEIVQTILSQNYIGSVIKEADPSEDMDDDDEDEVFGLISVINITEKKNVEFVKQVKSLVQDMCHQNAQKHEEQLVAILNDDTKHVGFIVSERFINIPPQIALPSYESLWHEVEKARKKGMPYTFEYFLLISKTYKLPQAGNKKSPISDQTFFANAEDEFFQKESILHFEYCVGEQRDGIVGGKWDDKEEEMQPYRTVMLVPSTKLQAVMARMKQELSQGAT